MFPEEVEVSYSENSEEAFKIINNKEHIAYLYL